MSNLGCQKSSKLPLLAWLVPLILSILTASPVNSQSFSEPNKFRQELVFSGNGTTVVRFSGSDKMYLVEKQGRILFSSKNTQGIWQAPTVFADLRTFVFPTAESGMLGLELDLNFTTNRYIYVFYSTQTDQRLVRIQANTDYSTMVPLSSTLILGGFPRAQSYHKAGDIRIHPKDSTSIYIALGDDGLMNESQQLDRYEGKLLRVNLQNGDGLASNPYYNGSTTSIRSRVWAIGMRNPFRFALHPENPDVIYISENGGPNNARVREDRITRVQKGADCAWNSTTYDWNGNLGANNPWWAPTDKKCKVLATDQPSIVGISLARGGGFGNAQNDTGLVMYVANMGFPSGAGGSIRRWKLTGVNSDSAEIFSEDEFRRFALGIQAVDLTLAPDGAMYATSTNGDEALGGWYSFRKIVATQAPTLIPSSVRKQEIFNLNRRTLHIQWNGHTQLEMFDITGKKVWSWRGEAPDFVSLPENILRGLYWLQMNNSKEKMRQMVCLKY